MKVKHYLRQQGTLLVVSVASHEDPLIKGMTTTISVNTNDNLAQAALQVNARLTEKINDYYREHFPIPATMVELYDKKILTDSSEKYPHKQWHYICPSRWRSKDTRELHLKYFRRHFLPFLSEAIDKNAYGPSTDEIIQNHIFEEVRQNILSFNQNKETVFSDTDLTAQAKTRADDHIDNCNILYDAFRRELDDFLRFPEVHVPRFDVERPIKPEQTKALAWEVMVTLAALFRLCLKQTSLSMAGILMMCGMLRTAEAGAPKFSDILFLGNYAVYGVIWQSDGSVRVADLKTDSAYRLVILPKFAVDCLLERKAHLKAQGMSEKDINRSFVVSAADDPFRPANPNHISAFVRKLMTALGCSEDFWAAANELMQKEPDRMPNGQLLLDLTCYVLRRSGCSYCCNTSGLDPRLVDVIMGHQLRQQDIYFVDELKREEIWAMIADHLECIVLDPDHSAHPAFLPRNMVPTQPAIIKRDAAHYSYQLRVTKEMMKSGTIRLVVESLENNDIEIGLPDTAKLVDYNTTHVITPRDYPCFFERLKKEDYVTCIDAATKIFENLFPEQNYTDSGDK